MSTPFSSLILTIPKRRIIILFLAARYGEMYSW